MTSHEDFIAKVRSLLKYLYDNGGRGFQSFQLLPISHYSIAQAINAEEFEAVVDYAEENRWLIWSKKGQMSLGRIIYHGIRLTPAGIEQVELASPTLFSKLSTCPLTGLSINGANTFTPLNGSEQALYTFKPIGQAIFDRKHLVALGQSIQAGNHTFRPDLAGFCRAKAERKQDPPLLTPAMFRDPVTGAPLSFEDKRAYFLKLFSEIWGKEHREKSINTFDDFPLASAIDAEEFYRILKSLLTENLIRYNNKGVARGDWKDNIQAFFPHVLLTSLGKQATTSSLRQPATTPINSFTVTGGIVNFTHGDYAVQTSVIGANSNVNASSGNQNTQGIQVSQLNSLPELVELIKQALDDSVFDSNREEINQEIERIEGQIHKPDPKKNILKRALDSLQELAADSAGAAGAHIVMNLLEQALAVLTVEGSG